MTHWIFLRGLTREQGHWGDFPLRFRAVIPGAEVHLMDLPGNGNRHKERSPVTVNAMVAACRAERERLGIDGPLHLLAMSLGAMVAIEWARSAPAELARCVLINTSLSRFSPFHHRLQPHNYLALLRLATGGMSFDAAEQSIFRLTCNRPDPDGTTLRRWVQIRKLRPVSPANGFCQLLAAARYRAPERAPSVHTLLLTSSQDHLVDPRCSEAIATAWGCPLRAHASAGHDLPHDDPQWVAEQVRDWMDSPSN